MKSILFAGAALGLALAACAEAAPSQPVKASASEAAPVAPVASGPSPEQVAADSANWRAVDPANLIVFETTKGRILIETFPEAAPAHVAQFTKIIRDRALDGTVFHRVINDFMAQGGDIETKTGAPSIYPNLKGEFTFRRSPANAPLEAAMGVEDSASSGFIKGFPIRTQAAFLGEMSKDGMVETYIPHCPGIVSTARTSDPNSANSQFFLMRQQSKHLDQQYTAWGRVISGLDVVRKIKHGPDEANGEVENPDVLVTARMAADLSGAAQPKAWVARTDTAAFKASVADKADVDVCELAAVQSVVK
jgi:peptidylprolyl isomerase